MLSPLSPFVVVLPYMGLGLFELLKGLGGGSVFEQHVGFGRGFIRLELNPECGPGDGQPG